MGKGIKQEIIVKPTLEEKVRYGNGFREPISDGGGVEDDVYSPEAMPKQYLNQALSGTAALGLLAAASKISPSRRTFLKVAGLGGLSAALSGCATAFVGGGTKTYESPNFIFNLPNELSKEAVDYIIEEHELGLKNLEQRLRIGQDYGRKLGGKITVGATYGSSMSYLYGDRAGTIDHNMVSLLNLGTTASNTTSNQPAIIHELTHQVTRSAGDFYSEGLAVYMQQEIGRNPTVPNYGADLHRKIADMELQPLNRFIAIQGLSRTLPENEVPLAYLQAGSFVKYLVEDVSKGDDISEKTRQFMKFFLVDGDYKRVFGKSFEELEQGWRGKIKNTKPLYTLSDALKVEHLNPRLQPTGELDSIRKRIADSLPRTMTTAGGYLYPIWVDVKLESRTEHLIELVNHYIDNIWEGQRIGGVGSQRIGFISQAVLKRRLTMLGNRLEPYKSRLVRDYPVPAAERGIITEFAVHYIYKLPNVSNEEFDAPVRMKKI